MKRLCHECVSLCIILPSACLCVSSALSLAERGETQLFVLWIRANFFCWVVLCYGAFYVNTFVVRFMVSRRGFALRHIYCLARLFWEEYILLGAIVS